MEKTTGNLKSVGNLWEVHGKSMDGFQQSPDLNAGVIPYRMIELASASEGSPFAVRRYGSEKVRVSTLNKYVGLS